MTVNHLVAGSSPAEAANIKENVMKKKQTPAKERNYLVKLALFRKAGSHKKSNKAIRKNEKQKGYYNGTFASLIGKMMYNGYCNAPLVKWYNT